MAAWDDVLWGSWEYSGGNGMRVGTQVTWGAVDSYSTTITASVDIWTENQYSYSDPQTLNISANLGSDLNFTNNDGTTPQKRTTRTYTYTYSGSSYNTSPGTVTFSATISGAYNGVTPTKSTTSTIPARPSRAPSAPGVAASPGNSFLSISYSTPSDTGSGGILRYEQSADNVNWGLALSNPFAVSGTNGVSQTHYVRAVSLYGGAGTSGSATATPRTIPTAPTSFAASSATFGQLGLSWAAPSSNGGASISGYRLRTGTTLGAGTLLYEGTGTSYTHTGLNPYTDYSYNIVAYNVAGESTDTTNATLTAKTMGGIAKVWNGTAYVNVLPKVWNGTTWANAQARMYDGVGATEDDKWKHGI